MKFLRHDAGQLLFELQGNDRDVLGWVLRLYPAMPSGPAEITRSKAVDPDGDRQRLLEEALASQRIENQRRIEAFLNASQRFEPQEANFFLRLTDRDVDWLLEVLNEVRVGSWAQLGRPQPGSEVSLPTQPESRRRYWAMELSAYLETRLLDGLAAQP